jgi:adenylate kinase
MKLIMVGPPGSGKGTVSERLEKDFSLKQISTGVLLRKNIKEETELGKIAKSYIDAGNLVPDDLVIKMLREEIVGKDNYVLDGFPRTIPQAEAIADLEITAVINLEVPEEVVVERFSGRRMCPKCSAGYHIKYVPPKTENVCDKCDSKLIQRDDDQPETVRERFNVYREKTQPLIDYFENKGLIKNVDGAPAPDIVYADVKKVVEELQL